VFLIDDFLQAWRGLRHSPAFLILASCVLALGLGATIFTYGVINTTSRKPPPFPEAQQLYNIFGAEPARGWSYSSMAYIDYMELREKQKSFEDIAAYYSGTAMISGDRRAERYTGGTVTWNFLRVLQMKPLLGRDFTPEDDLPDAKPTVILGYELWRTRFNRDPDVIGRVVRVNARPSIVIGVMPKGFSYPANEELWTPMQRDVTRERRGDQSYENSVGVTAVARLAKHVTREQAAQEAAGVFARLAKLYPRSNAGITTNVLPVAEGAVGDVSRVITTMFVAVILVLLIACANVASLIFVRANVRVYEAGMRVALGARRSRLVVQMLGESIIISLFGVAGGLVLAALALHFTEVAVRNLSEAKSPLWWTFSIDGRVALFAAGAALIAALLSGIVPALRASRPDVMRILRDGGRTGTGMRLNKFTAAMVIVEVAFSAALLTGAGLMTRASVISLQRDFGADVRGFMSARVGLPLAKYPTQEQGRFFETLVARLRTQPGVQSAVAATSMPGSGAEDWRFAIDGEIYDERADYPIAHAVTVTAGFFEAFRRPALRGREFSAEDRADSAPVAMVNEAFVAKFFPDEDAIGRRIRSADDSNTPPLTIIGVTPNINHDKGWKEDGFAPTIYRPVTQLPWRFMTVAVRVAGDPRPYGNLLRSVTQQLDPDLAPYWIKTLEEFQIQRRDALRLLSNVFIGFAFIAIILAAVGIYGVLAFATGQRNREIGVRRALGAHDRQILGTVMRGALFQLAIGLGLGALLAPLMGRALSRALKDGLFGLSPDDPTVYSIVFLLLVIATMLASWIPARRALRVQPSSALRCE
jgi:putative ABC transport system permease protein